jgi:hypothetical protein
MIRRLFNTDAVFAIENSPELRVLSSRIAMPRMHTAREVCVRRATPARFEVLSMFSKCRRVFRVVLIPYRTEIVVVLLL